MKTVEKNLHKLTFKVWTSKSDEPADFTSEPAELSFIYGICTEGLSDFEMAIEDLDLQEPFDLEIDRSKLKSYFGWLHRALGSNIILPGSDETVRMKFELQQVLTPEPREIVTAMAELQSHGGCGSDCGCGCH